MTKVTIQQISNIFLNALAQVYHFNGKPDFPVEIYLEAIDRMGFKDDKELRRVHNEIVRTCERMPKPAKIEEILNQNRKEKEAETIVEQQEKMVKDVTRNDGNHWQRVQKMLLEKYGENVYKSWFSLLQYHKIEGSTAVISTPTRFIREWIITNYERSMLKGWKHVNPDVKKIRFVVRPDEQQHARQQYNNKASTLYGGRYG